MLGNAAVLATMVSKRIYRFLPVFSAYLLLLLVTGISYSCKGLIAASTFYLALSFADSAFTFAILMELSMSALRSVRPSLPRWTPVLIAYAIALVYAATWQFMKGLDAAARWTPFTAYTTCLELSASGLQMIFFIAFAVVSQIADRWRSVEMQIAAGLGFLSFINLWAMMIQLNLKTTDAASLHQYHILDELRSLGWCCVMAYWTVCFARGPRGWQLREFRKDL